MLLKGITVELEVRRQEGTDEYNRPVYSSTYEEVENVLVGRPSEEELLDSLDLSGRRAQYTLGIPKGDTHEWADRKVRFWGQEFHTIGHPVRGIESLVPLAWGQNVRVEIYGSYEGEA